MPELRAPAIVTVVAPASAGPIFGIGVIPSAAKVTIGGDAAQVLMAEDGTVLASLAPGRTHVARAIGDQLRVDGMPGVRTGRLFVRARGDDAVRVDTRAYGGEMELVASRGKLTAINRIGLEEYLVGVVSAEMGRRPDGDREAILAQAIVSRTYALRNRGRWKAEGYDLRGGVSDQVYSGRDSENSLAREAVGATAGVAVTYNGAPVDAFYFSTCGGRTERSTEVFSGASRPYLQGSSDLAPDGTAYCRLSPRFAWTQTWSGAELRRIVGASLPAVVAGVSVERARSVSDLSIGERTASRRARSLAVTLRGGVVTVPSGSIRSVLRAPNGAILMSTLFTLDVRRTRDGLVSVTATGSGNGHGVGLCQWGAIGRARAGQDFREIIAAYFPGTRLERLY